MKKPEDSSDDLALLKESRLRANKLLDGLQREASEWKPVQAGQQAIADQGRAAISEIIRAVEKLTAVIDADCSVGQGK